MESIGKIRNSARLSMSVPSAVLLEDCDEIEREIAERYMQLPLAHDGKPVHVGDRMQLVGDGKRNFGASAVGVDCIYSDTNTCYGLYEVEHYQPTTEDVLEDFMRDVCLMNESYETHNDIIAKYAAKLQLKEAE